MSEWRVQLSSSPVPARWAHARLAALLAAVVAGAGGLLALAVPLGLPQGRDTFAFMAAEVHSRTVFLFPVFIFSHAYGIVTKTRCKNKPALLEPPQSHVFI